MSRAERVVVGVLCMIYREDEILLQARAVGSRIRFAFPGGHVERGESFVDAVRREMLEETGLTIENPHLCGVKQVMENGERSVILMFKADKFHGTLTSSDEGEMSWILRRDAHNYDVVTDFDELLAIFDGDEFCEYIWYREQNNEPWTTAKN